MEVYTRPALLYAPGTELTRVKTLRSTSGISSTWLTVTVVPTEPLVVSTKAGAPGDQHRLGRAAHLHDQILGENTAHIYFQPFDFQPLETGDLGR